MNKLEFKIVNSLTNENILSSDCMEEIKQMCKQFKKVGIEKQYHIEAWDDYTLVDTQEINVYFEL